MPKPVTEPQIKIHIQILRETPDRIAACTAQLDEAGLTTPLAPGEWSIAAIMAHLRSCAEVWSYSIYAMLTLDNPELTYIHPRDWAKKQKYQALTFAENFEAFNSGRQNLLSALEGLSLEQWRRSATFTGKANTYTIFGEAIRMARHELDHCLQLETILSASKE